MWENKERCNEYYNMVMVQRNSSPNTSTVKRKTILQIPSLIFCFRCTIMITFVSPILVRFFLLTYDRKIFIYIECLKMKQISTSLSSLSFSLSLSLYKRWKAWYSIMFDGVNLCKPLLYQGTYADKVKTLSLSHSLSPSLSL